MIYIYLFFVAFIQNMAFTWVSRSRQSGNPKKHAVAATFSNSIWFVCNFFILFPVILKTIAEGDMLSKLVLMLVYVSATVLGSVVMMKINLGHWYVPFLTEKKDKDKVGSR
jgi:hypothetical protein